MYKKPLKALLTISSSSSINDITDEPLFIDLYKYKGINTAVTQLIVDIKLVRNKSMSHFIASINGGF